MITQFSYAVVLTLWMLCFFPGPLSGCEQLCLHATQLWDYSGAHSPPSPSLPHRQTPTSSIRSTGQGYRMDKVVCFPRTETPLRLFCLFLGEPGSETRDVCDVTKSIICKRSWTAECQCNSMCYNFWAQTVSVQDVIPGVMHWKQFPSHCLLTLEGEKKLSTVWKPRWWDHQNKPLSFKCWDKIIADIWCVTPWSSL